MDDMIRVPGDILWDYEEPPADLLWRLQRIADYFSRYGTEREVVELLHAHRAELKLDDATKKLIEEYYLAWQARR